MRASHTNNDIQSFPASCFLLLLFDFRSRRFLQHLLTAYFDNMLLFSFSSSSCPALFKRPSPVSFVITSLKTTPSLSRKHPAPKEHFKGFRTVNCLYSLRILSFLSPAQFETHQNRRPNYQANVHHHLLSHSHPPQTASSWTAASSCCPSTSSPSLSASPSTPSKA